MADLIALWACPVSNLAGVARHILDVARVGLPGYRLVVTAPEGPLLDELRRLNIAVVPWEVDGRPVRRTVAELRRTVRRLAPAVVHSHLAKADFLAAMATTGLPITLISTEHHIQADQSVFHGSVVKARTRQVAHHTRIRRFDALLAVSASTERDMRAHWRPTSPITVVRNGVDRLPATTRGAGLRVLSLTRLSPEKNLATTLRVFAEVHREHPDARLTLAGEGPDAARLRRLTDELGLADVVAFPGFVDAGLAMAQHDVLQQPSLADNLSYTLLDAVNAGMGVVASDLGGNPEILPEHCLAHADDVAGLATRVIEQGLQAELRPSLPATIPTVAEMVDQIADVYRCTIPQDTGAPAPTQPAASIVIAYYRNAATLREQLDALARQLTPPSFEVVVADNEGSVDLPGLLDEYSDRLSVRSVTATAVRGQCHARNVGVDAAAAQVVLICDADDVVGDRWVRSLSDRLVTEDALVTGPLRLDRLNPEYAWRTYLGVSSDEVVPAPVLQRPFGFLDYEQFAVGCNLGFRRETFQALGGFDETITGGTEDVDLSWRFIEAGHPLVTVEQAVVDYRLRTDPAAVFTQRRGYARSQLRLWAKSRDLGRPVRGMSARWAMTETAKLTTQWLGARKRPVPERFRWSAYAGSVIGNLEGQLIHRRPGRR